MKTPTYISLAPRPIQPAIYDWEQAGEFQEVKKDWTDNKLLLFLFCIGLALILTINFK